jgi:hypothetical protein
MKNILEGSRALWNRTSLNLASDEALAQLLDRGEMAAWRELYKLARADAHLRGRIKQIALTVPLPLPHFWLAALESLGESIDWDTPVPDYFDSTGV